MKSLQNILATIFLWQLPLLAIDPPSLLSMWGSAGTNNSQFNGMHGLAVDLSGYVYAADLGNHRIQKFANWGSLYTQWGSQGNGDGQFVFPTTLALDSTANVYVVDQYNYRIQKFSPNGSFITKWGASGTGDGQFSQPVAVAVSSANEVYVVDDTAHRIQKFDSSGNFISKWGAQGTGPGEFYYPGAIGVDSVGNVYVGDFNARIQKFSSDGTYLLEWGSKGTGDGEMSSPGGIAADTNGNIYITDYSNHRVQIFSNTGQFLGKWGSFGTDPGQFKSAAGIAIDTNNNVFVVDVQNSRIQKFGFATIPEEPGVPIPSITAPNQAAPGTSVVFDASSSSHENPTKAIVLYEWDFDYDGVTFEASQTGVTVTNTFGNFGSFNVGLRVTDNNSPAAVAITNKVISIDQGNRAPIAGAGGPYYHASGQPITLDSTGSSDPDAAFGDSIVSYAWDLNNDGVYGDATGGQPTVSWALLKSYGVYVVGSSYTIRVRATDSFGSLGDAQTLIIIGSAPKILIEPADVNLLYDGNGILSVKVSGSAPFTYQWYKQNSPITSGTNNLLRINPVTLDTADTYYVVVTNSFGSKTSKVATVTVNDTFLRAAGAYHGLFYPTSNLTIAKSGYVAATLETRQSLSGKITMNSGTYSFRGLFSTNMTFSTTVSRAATGHTDLQLEASLVEEDGTFFFHGTISEGTWVASIVAVLAHFQNSGSPAPQQGTYTMTLLPGGDGSQGPGHGSSAVLTVQSNGVLKASGKLSDDTGFSQTTAISKHGYWPFYSKPYSGTGLLMGWLLFEDQPTSKFNGAVIWIKPGPFGAFYTDGFTNIVTGVGSLRR